MLKSFNVCSFHGLRLLIHILNADPDAGEPYQCISGSGTLAHMVFFRSAIVVNYIDSRESN